MRKALIRFEDVSPGGIYYSSENTQKLRIIADYLHSEGVPFHISIIPRYINPIAGYDKSIADVDDPVIKEFVATLDYMNRLETCSLGMHGYTHQYGNSVSGVGFEFHYSGCESNCPPDDTKEACINREDFINSYTSSRMRQGYEAYKISNISIDWGFSTPHYTASENQRCILEAWSGIFFENDPLFPNKRTLTIRDVDKPLYRGVIYVPTPLGYVSEDNSDADIERICNEIKTYTEEEIAAFFYHPYLEFPFIEITENGVVYDDNSYLKRLIRCFKDGGFTFVPLLSLVNFVPSTRQTDFFGDKSIRIFIGDIEGNGKDDLFVWEYETGTWHSCVSQLEKFPNRQCYKILFTERTVLTNWAVGDYWVPLVGDFNGDGKDDIVVWNPITGDWQVAISDGSMLIPDKGRGDYSWLKPWAVGDYWVPLVGDFNGDGKDDIAVWNPIDGDWQVAISDGTKLIPDIGRGDYSWLKSWAVGDYWVPLVGDFNGDGKDDIVVWNPIDGDWQVAISDGTKFIPDIGRGDYSWIKPWAIGFDWQAFAGDFDGDGIDDILVVDIARGDWQVALSNKSYFEPVGAAFQPWAADSEGIPFVGDFNGSGTTSIAVYHPNIRNGTVDSAISVIGK